MSKDTRLISGIFVVYLIYGLFSYGRQGTFISPHLIDELVLMVVSIIFLVKTRKEKLDFLFVGIFTVYSVAAALSALETWAFMEHWVQAHSLADFLKNYHPQLEVIHAVTLLLLLISLFGWIIMTMRNNHELLKYYLYGGLVIIIGSLTALFLDPRFSILMSVSTLLFCGLITANNKLESVISPGMRRYLLLFVLGGLLHTMEYISMMGLISQ